MKICFVTETYSPDYCGVADYVNILATNLDFLGHEVHIITRYKSTERIESTIQKIKVHRVLKCKFYIKDLLSTINNIGNIDIIDLQLAYSGQSQFKRNITFNFLPLILGLYKFCKRQKYQLILTIHELRSFQASNKSMVYKIICYLREFPTFLFLNGVILTTQEYHNLVKYRTRGIIKSLLNFSNIEKAEISDELTLLRNRMYGDISLIISFFGSIALHKNIEKILRVIKKIQDFTSTRLILIGPWDEQYKIHLDNIAQELDIFNNIEFLGPLPAYQVSVYLQLSDVSLYLFKNGVSPRNASVLASLEQGLDTLVTTSNPELFKEYIDVYGTQLYILDVNVKEDEIVKILLEIQKRTLNKSDNEKIPKSMLKEHLEQRLKLYQDVIQS